MGIRERKPAAAQASPRQQPRPVDKAIAAEIRRRAEKLTEALEIPGNNGAQGRNHERRQTERQMAVLRGEAVQARRLAEHIENLSREAAASRHIRKPAMTDTTIIDPGHAKRRQRNTDNKPGPSGNRLNFNPLHPSMELPPEQLIRLLGMESKKIRNSIKKRQAPKQAAVVEPQTETGKGDDGQERTPPAKVRPQAVSPVDRSIQYERSETPQVFGNSYSGLLVPSLVVGVVAGIVVSGYLFWSQPADTLAQKTPTPAAAKQAPTVPSERQLVKRTAPTTASAAKPKMSTQESAKWRATIKAEERRLRTTADQRLSERFSQIQQSPQSAVTHTAPVSDASPVPTPEPDTTPGRIDEAVLPVGTRVERPLPKPVPATAELQDAQPESAVIEAVQPDEGVTPDESTAAMPAAIETESHFGGDNTTAEETPDNEFAAAVSAISDVAPEAYSSTEAELLPESVEPAD